MCEFDDSLTEIDWLNSLCIQNRSEIKDGNSLPITKPAQCIFATPLNSLKDVYSIPRCNGYDKPSYSYAYLIKLAIESSKNKRMKLNEIYSWITETFPYYKYVQIDNNKGWKNAIRHNLSLNKIFKRCAKDSTHLGKGSYWMIDSNFDEEIQYPPVKKLKLSFNSPESVKSNNTIDHINFGGTHLLEDQSILRKGASIRVPIISTLLSPTHMTTINTIGPIMTSAPIISGAHFEAVSMDLPILFSQIQSENKPNLFSSDSAFSTYANGNHGHNLEIKVSEMPEYSCEISYYSKPIYSKCSLSSSSSTNDLKLLMSTLKYSNDILNESNSMLLKSLYSVSTPPQNGLSKNELEVEEDIMTDRNVKDDFIVKTPVLSQINSIPEDMKPLALEIKDIFEERTTTKCSTSNNYYTNSTQDTTEAPFDNLSLYDSFHQPLFESESRSFELSQSTRKYLFNISGVKETLLNRSQWLDLQEHEELNSQCTCDVFYETFRSDDLYSSEEKNNLNEPNREIAPTKEYLELKSSLINYQYKSNVTGSNQHSVSTSSTEKSSNTIRSKSDLFKKSNSFDSTSDFENLKQDVADNCKCETEDEIRDFFPWDSIT